MRICMITSAEMPPKEGIGSHVMNLSYELANRGHAITVLTRGTLRRSEEATLQGVSVIRVPFAPFYPLHIDVHELFLKEALHKTHPKPDLLHYHSPLVPFLGGSYLSVATLHTPMAFDVPRVEVVDAVSLGARIMLHTTSKRVERRLVRGCQVVATVCSAVSRELMTLGVSPDKLAVVGTGVDERVFKPSCNQRDWKSVLAVGRLSYRKGFLDLLEAFEIVAQHDRHTHLTIVGDGPLRQRLESYARVKDLSNAVTFVGWVSTQQLVTLYQQCGVFVLPSHYEGLPAVLLEALASEAPVVATAVGGIPDVIDGKNGVLVEPKNPANLASTIMRVLDYNNRSNEMGVRGRQSILAQYTWKEVAARVERLYETVLGRTVQ